MALSFFYVKKNRDIDRATYKTGCLEYIFAEVLVYIDCISINLGWISAGKISQRFDGQD